MNVTLPFGAPTSHSSLVCQYAIERGWFAEAGLNVAVSTIHGGPELARAYDDGSIPMGEMGSPPAITAISRGGRFRIVGSSMRRGVALYLATAPQVRDVRALRGATLGALSLGSCSDWYLREVLRQSGIDPDRDVTIRSLGADHQRVLDLFATGEISAALLSGLNIIIGESRGVLRCQGSVFDLARVPQLQWSVYVANQEFLRASPELARRVLEVLAAAGRNIEQSPEDWLAFTAQRFGISLAQARQVYELEAPHLHFGGELDLAGLREAVRVQQGLGAIENETPLEALIANSPRHGV